MRLSHILPVYKFKSLRLAICTRHNSQFLFSGPSNFTVAGEMLLSRERRMAMGDASVVALSGALVVALMLIGLLAVNLISRQ